MEGSGCVKMTQLGLEPSFFTFVVSTITTRSSTRVLELVAIVLMKLVAIVLMTKVKNKGLQTCV